jgi:hypothetical protein
MLKMLRTKFLHTKNKQQKHVDQLKQKIARARKCRNWWREFQLQNKLKIAERKIEND